MLQYNEVDGLFYTEDGEVATREQVGEYHMKLFDMVFDMFNLDNGGRE